MKIFLIAGKSHVGKGEVAKIIQNYYNQLHQKSIITEYSKYIKLFAEEMTHWKKEEQTKPRKFLQDMGYFIRNRLNMPDFFINRMKEDLQVYRHFFDHVIIADVRYPEEIDKIKEIYPNTYAILITRNESNNLTEEESNHESEHALKNYEQFDYIIENNEKEKLREDIQTLLKNLEEGEY